MIGHPIGILRIAHQELRLTGIDDVSTDDEVTGSSLSCCMRPTCVGSIAKRDDLRRYRGLTRVRRARNFMLDKVMRHDY